MTKHGREMFFIRGHHIGARIFVRPFRDLPGSLYEKIVIHFRILVFMIFGPEIIKLYDGNVWHFIHAVIFEVPGRR